MADSTSMDAVLKLIQSLSGKGNTTTQTTSGGSSTTQTMLDQNTINATLKSALESNQGLASLAAGQNNSGMYNSTVNKQMTDDLLARMTTASVVAGAPTVKTSTPTVTTGVTKGPGIMDQLGPIAALSLGKKGIDKFLAGDFSFGGATDSAVNAGQTAVSDFVNTNTLSGVETASGAAFDAGSSILDSLGDSAINTAVGSGFDSALWGLGSSAIADTAVNTATSTAADEAGSSLFSGTVICTEAARQGVISFHYLELELAQLERCPLNVYVKSGYHVLAAPVVRWMKRSKAATEFFAKWAISYILGDCQGKSDLKHKFIKFGLFPVCWVVGRIAGKEE